jgi:hypothetical protein
MALALKNKIGSFSVLRPFRILANFPISLTSTSAVIRRSFSVEIFPVLLAYGSHFMSAVQGFL